MVDNLEITRNSINAQLAGADAELATLIARGMANSGRAGSLRAQRAKLLGALRELEAALRRYKAEELQRRMGGG